MRLLTVSVGQQDPAQITSVQRVSWPAFCKWFAKRPPVAADKAARGWYCGAEFSEPRRHGDFFVARHLLTLDFDDLSEVDAEHVAFWLATSPWASVWYTTFSHTPDKPRLRVLLPLSRPCSTDEFQAVSRKIAERIGIELAARESHTPCQMMYAPAVRAEAAPWRSVVREAGKWVDVDAVLAEYTDWTDRSSWPRRKEHDDVARADLAEDPRLKPGLIGAFCRTFTITDAIRKFELPYLPTDNPERWTYAKGSRPEGVTTYDLDSKAHSYHDTDPARGQHNAFDLVRLHKFGALDTEEEQAKPITERASFRAMMNLAVELPEIQNERVKEEFEPLPDLTPEEQTEVKAKIDAEQRIIVAFSGPRVLTTGLEAARNALLQCAEQVEVLTYGNRMVRPILTTTRRGFGAVPIESVELAPYNPVGLTAAMSRRIDFCRRSKDAEGKTVLLKMDCPGQLAQALISEADKLPELAVDHIAMTPIINGNGLHSRRGHDRELRAWLLAPEGIEVPAKPTETAARAALARVESWLGEFPFESPLDKSAALAALLTAALRASLDHAPGILVSKPDYGSGASTLCDLIHVVLTGRPAAVINASLGRQETDKAIDSVQLAGLPAIVIDNVVDGEQFNSIALAQVLSQQTRQVRVLGESTVVSVPCTQLVLVNGNNIRIADDLIRRFIRIRLDPHMESPHTRLFKKPEIISDAQSQRALLLSDLFTIAIAYRHAERKAATARLAGFSRWLDAVAGPLVWLGRLDPSETQSRISTDDERKGALRALLVAWRTAYGDATMTVRQILEEEMPDEDAKTDAAREHARRDLRQLFLSVCPSPRGGLDPARVGRWLQGISGRVVDGLTVEAAGIGHGGVRRWHVKDLKKEDWLS